MLIKAISAICAMGLLTFGLAGYPGADTRSRIAGPDEPCSIGLDGFPRPYGSQRKADIFVTHDPDGGGRRILFSGLATSFHLEVAIVLLDRFGDLPAACATEARVQLFRRCLAGGSGPFHEWASIVDSNEGSFLGEKNSATEALDDAIENLDAYCPR